MNKKIYKDFSYNIMSSLISTGVLQIIAYPILARIFDSSTYGVLLTVMGIVNTVAVSVGNTLNNTRLIRNSIYDEKRIVGDFNAILSFASVIGAVVIWVIGRFMFQMPLLTNVLMFILVLLMSMRAYFMVTFRIVLDFKSNFICNMFISFGYLLGVGAVYLTKQWPLIFILAEICGLFWIYKDSAIYRESFKLTKLFKFTLSQFVILLLVTLSTNVMLYLDRMVIYPILGSESVSIYTVAVFFGKSLGIIMTPIAGVLLGYFAQKEYKMSLKKFWQTNSIVIIFSIVFMLLSVVLAPIATKILYPSYYDAARTYIFYANMAAVIGVIASMAQPAVLRFVPAYWQLVKEGLYAAVYLGLGIPLLNRFGLLGFCYASIMANLAKVLILYSLGTIYFAKSQITVGTSTKLEMRRAQRQAKLKSS